MRAVTVMLCAMLVNPTTRVLHSLLEAALEEHRQIKAYFVK